MIQQLATDAGAKTGDFKICAALPYLSQSTSADATQDTIRAEAAKNKAADSACVALRNTMVSIVMLNSEDLCVAHRRSIYGREATFNITAGTFTSLFSGWAAVAPSAHGKAILAALALFSNSERSLVNEMVYKSAIVPAVDRKILALRDEAAMNIESRFADSALIYPIPIAMRDAIHFHYSCSFMSGLEKVIEEGTQESPRQKAARLNRVLESIQAKIRQLILDKKTDDPSYSGLQQRSASLVTEITSLEKQ